MNPSLFPVPAPAWCRISRAMALVMVIAALAACNKAPEPAAGQNAPSVAIDTPTPESPLAIAATRGDLAEVKGLLDKGADINATDALGRTPLHMAAFYNRQKTSLLLIGRGAKLDARDRAGMTPLHAAVLSGNEAETELLLTMGADINATTDTKQTALHLAAAIGQVEITKALIQHSANPKAKDALGKTPLYYATTNQHQAAASLLQDGPARK